MSKRRRSSQGQEFVRKTGEGRNLTNVEKPAVDVDSWDEWPLLRQALANNQGNSPRELYVVVPLDPKEE
jgi:hypothetical protein